MKEFNHPELGKIILIPDHDEETGKARISLSVGNEWGIATLNFHYSSEEARDKAMNLFEEKEAFQIAENLLKQFLDPMEGDDAEGE